METLLAELAGAGSVIKHDAGLPAREPAPLYRITPAGIGEVARLLGEPAPTVSPPRPADVLDHH